MKVDNLYLRCSTINRLKIDQKLVELLEASGAEMISTPFIGEHDITVHNRSVMEKIQELESRIDKVENGFSERKNEIISNLKNEIKELENIYERKFIIRQDVWSGSYIKFNMNGKQYYIQWDDNYFFPMQYVVIPDYKDNHYGYYMHEFKQNWNSYDFILKYEATENEIEMAAKNCFEIIQNMKMSDKYRR